MSFWDLFTLPYGNIYSILLTFAFIIAAAIGYILLYQQIHLVKAETISIWDHLKCLLYGIVFSSGMTVILTTLVAFRLNKKHPSVDITELSRLLLWPLTFIILLLYVFPLIDFLYMAYSEKYTGMTPFQEFFAEKIIHRFKQKWHQYLVALILWIGLFILPPAILSFTGIPVFMSIMGWSFIYPIVIIAYLGNRGYVTGVVKNTYTHHTMKRSFHLTFDKSTRIFGVIFHRFFSTVMLIIQIVIYVVMFVVFILFTVYLFIGKVPPVKGTSFQTFALSLSFIFGIIGYFTRFWNKKIKFRWIDVLLSAWLIASVGINVMTNFMILRIDNGLAQIFEKWSVTEVITDITVIDPGRNYVLFIPVALIEEIMFIIFVNYYIFSKNSKFLLEAKLNLMEMSTSKFNPIPLFNFVHHSNAQLRRVAKHELIQMYSRLPVRNDIKFTHKRYMNPLFDSLSDSNKYNREVAQDILNQTIKSHPDKILPKIVEIMNSGNTDAILNIGQVLKLHPEFISKLPSNSIVKLFSHPSYQLKRLGADLILTLPIQPSSLSNESILNGISNPDYELQGKCMEIATKYGLLKDINILLNKVKGSHSHLQQVAIQSFVGLINRDDVQLTNKDIDRIIKELNSGNTTTRNAAILSISKVKDLKQFKIPFEPFLSGIKSQIRRVREASEHVLRQLIPNLKKNDLSQLFNTFITLSESADEETIHHLLPLLAANWKQFPQKVMSILLKFLQSSSNETQKAVENALVEIAKEDPQIILDSLMPIQEERSYLTKSILQNTLHRIGSQNPESIKLLEDYVRQSNVTVKKNALTAMEDLSKDYAEYFDQHLLIEEIKTESFAEIRLKVLNVLSNIIQFSSRLEPEIVTDLLPLLDYEDRDVRKRSCGIFEEIAKIDSSLISMDIIRKLSRDENPSIRESSAKIARYYVDTQKESTIELLNKLIEDDKWIVQSAVIDTLMQSKWELEADLIGKIIGLIDQPDEWLSRKVLEFIQFIGKKQPDQIPIRKIQQLSSHPNPHIRSMVLKIIELLSFEIAWELLLNLMQDEDPQVRDQAVRSLVVISKNMSISNLYSHTLKYFSDETDIILQRSIANALQRIVKYESAEIKNRLIGILKIRCQLSQDPILCQIWHELERK